MNRLQKKCVLATAGVHLLLFVILLVGPAFFQPRHKADDLQVLDVIPANLIDALRTSGVQNAQPPPPAVQPAPTPPVVQPPVTPPPPAPSPEPVVKPEPVKPAPVPDKVQSHKIEPNLKKVVRHTARNVSNNPPQTPQTSQQARALRNAIRSLKNNFSTSTTVDMPGDSNASYANYASVVVSVYKHAWVPPDGMDNDNAIVRFTVTIASDGTVISARIIEPSGDAKIDAAVQRELERVTSIAPFPEGAPEKQRDYTLNFNATRRTLE
ncbi:MAG TPA: TonB family protein [Verrucomicrobiae bacterium]|nr:TonB family protein [Verrucomicrobiae bacterium]